MEDYLGFQDKEKVDKNPNVDLPLIFTVVIANHSFSKFLVDEETPVI